MENIKIGLEISSNTKSETADAKKLNEQLKQAAETAKNIRVGGGQPAPESQATATATKPTSGYKAAKQPTGALAQMSPGGSANEMTPKGYSAIAEYNRARGSAGATGASARDFANEAQGLSGLVRLYAVYAANVYALAAAFSALSKAMDTTNMIRGMDQLGARSGVALGVLSKELVNATGGAISLREAMQATVKVTAAGLGSENVLRLGEVAAKASQALGVDMTDAVNRLSRGITKLEPELLDELGIFTKIDPAVEKYALTLGKTAAQLTDFERRQAFALAVLEEGEKKFAAIQVDANPYNKLSASFQNLIQSGLELLNKLVTPLVSFLSSSPTALTSIIALLGVNLLKKALPALAEFKQGLEQTANKSNDILKQRVKEAQTIRDNANQIAQKSLNINIEKEIAAVDKAEKAVQAIRDRQFSKVKDPKAIAAISTLQDPLLDPTSLRAQEAINVARLEAVRISNLKQKGSAEEARAIRDITDSTEKWGIATIKQKEQQSKLDAETEKLQKSLISVAGINARLAASAEQKALRDNIVQTTAYNASIVGLNTSLTILKDKIAEENITGFGKATLLARGYVAALSGAVNVLASAISKVFFYVGIIIAVYESLQLLGSWFSKNQEEQKKFADAIDKNEERLKAFGRTVDEINKKPFAERLSADSVVAKATSVQELSNSVTELITNFEKQQKAAGSFDKLIDKLFGGKNADKLAQNLSKTIFTILQQSVSSPEAEKAKQNLASLLDIDVSATETEFQAAIRNIIGNSEKLKLVDIEVAKLNKSLNASANTSKTLKNSVEDTDRAYKQFLTSLRSTDPLSVFSEKAREAGINLVDSLSDPTLATQNLLQLIKDSGSVSFFSTESYNKLLNITSEVAKLTDAQSLNSAVVEKSQQEYDKLAKKVEDLRQKSKRLQEGASGLKPVQLEGEQIVDPLREEIAAAQQLADAAKENLKEAKNALTDSVNKGYEFTKQFRFLAIEAFERGANNTKLKIEAALSKGSTTIVDNILSGLGDIQGVAKLRAENEKKAIDQQIRLLKSNDDLIVATRQNTLSRQLGNALETKRQAEDRLAQIQFTKGQDEPESAIEKQLKEQVSAADRAIEALSNIQQAITTSPGKAMQNINSAIAKAKRDTGSIDKDTLQLYNEQLAFLSSRAEVLGNINQLVASKLSLEDTAQIQTYKEQEEKLQRLYDTDLKRLKIAQDEINLQETRRGFLTSEEIARRGLLEEAQTSIEQSKEVSAALREVQIREFQLAALKKAPPPTDAKELQARQDVISNLEKDLRQRREDLDLKGISNELALALVRAKTSNQIIADNTRIRAQERAIRDIQLERNSVLKELNIQTQEVTSNLLKSSGITLSPEYLAQQEASLAAARQRYEFEKFIAVEEEQNARKKQDLQQQIDKLTEASDAKERERLIIQRDQADALAKERIAQQTRLNELKLQEIEIIEKARLKEAERERQIRFYGEFSQSLIGVFQGLGDSTQKFGEGLANVLKDFGQFTVDIGKARQDINELIAKQKSLAEIEDPTGDQVKDYVNVTSEISRKRKQLERDEIAGNAKLVSSAKSMFKEKSVAYKALNAVEKGLHLARLAMDNKELIHKLTGLQLGVSAKYAAELEETAALYGGATARAPITITEIFGKITSQLGIFGPAVAAAVVASIFGAVADRGSTNVPQISAQDRQATQGTAMEYNQQGERVQTSRGVLGDPEAKSDTVVKALEILRDNSVVGLRYNDRLLKAFERLGKSIENTAVAIYKSPGILRGPVPGVATGELSNTQGTSTLVGATAGGVAAGAAAGTALGAKLGIVGGPLGIIAGALLGAVVGSLFGKKVTQEVTDSGLILKGTFLDIAKGAEGVIEGFATIQTTTKRRFRRTRVSSADIDIEVDDKIKAAVEDSFDAAVETIFATAEVLGSNLDTITSKLETFDLRGKKISLRGLKGEELAQELQAVIGGIVDQAFELSFQEIADTYAKRGETATVTVLRVADTNRKIEQALANIAGGKILELSLDATEAIAELGGGLDQFLDKLNKYAENFLTEEERLAPVRKEVNDELKRLGLSGIKTRAQFKQAVDYLQQTGQTASDTFISLININEAFAQVTASAQAATDALQKEYDTRAQELTKVRDEFTGFAKSLRDYSLNLQTSAASPLLPQQQYALLRAELIKTRDLAATGDTAAIQRLQSVGDKFLQSSRTMFASSEQYTSDFNLVLAATQTTADFAESQAQVASNTLSEIKNTVGQLITLNETAASVAVELTGLGPALTAAVNAFKKETDYGGGFDPRTMPVQTTEVDQIISEFNENRAASAAAQAAAEAARVAAEAAKAAAEAAARAAGSLLEMHSGGSFLAATGMAFDTGGIRKYAKGGIVSAATPFSYSEGLGVMGEAGPEAIMPLKRTQNGNLGVIAEVNTDKSNDDSLAILAILTGVLYSSRSIDSGIQNLILEIKYLCTELVSAINISGELLISKLNEFADTTTKTNKISSDTLADILKKSQDLARSDSEKAFADYKQFMQKAAETAIAKNINSLDTLNVSLSKTIQDTASESIVKTKQGFFGLNQAVVTTLEQTNALAVKETQKGFLGLANTKQNIDFTVESFNKSTTAPNITNFNSNIDLSIISATNQKMAEQLDKLNKQVEQLTQVVAEGAVLNAEATNRNTEEVTQAVNQTTQTVDYKVKLVDRTRIV